MRRRRFLAIAGGGLVALVGAGAGVWSQVPVIPKRPLPGSGDALGWIAHHEGRFTLVLPRAEMGQNIATALKQVACAELGATWDAVDVELHATDRIGHVKATVGSESVMQFAEPLAQACAALRDALAAGRLTGDVAVTSRPFSELRAFTGASGGVAAPEIVQGRAIVTGAPLYAADIRLPGMAHGRVLRAPASLEARSWPHRWNVAAARAVPGFVAVVEACGPPLGGASGLGIVVSRPGVLDTVEKALGVQWHVEPLADGTDIAAAVDVDTRLAQGPLPHAILDGEPMAGGWDVDIRLDVPLAAHGPIEPRAAVATEEDGRLVVWAGTQDAFYVRDHLADLFDRPESGVLVRSCRIGGGFGGRTLCTVEAEAAALALSARRPVKVQWSRAQEFAQAFHRPPASHRVRARLEAGRIVDWDHDLVSSHVLFTSAALPGWMQAGTNRFVGDPGAARGLAAPYALGRMRARYDVARLPVHTGPWRGLGAGPNGLAIESAIDEAAIAAGADPLAFRLDHVDDPLLGDVLRRVAEIADWGATATPGLPTERTGRGLGCGIYKGSSHAAVVADVAVAADGRVRVTRLWCAHECGFVINADQVRAQCEGNLVWSLGLVLSDELPVDNGRVSAESFADAPIPRLSETPPITVSLVESTRTPAGAGETAMAAAPGAIANAVRAATGIRPVRFPLRGGDFAA